MSGAPWLVGIMIVVCAAVNRGRRRRLRSRLAPPAESMATARGSGRRAERRRAVALAADLAPWMEGIARELRAGAALGPAIVSAAATVGGAIGPELAALAPQLERLGVAETLARWTAGIASDTFAPVVAIVSVGVSSGGELAPAFAAAAEVARDRAELSEEVASLTAQARASAVLLSALPPFAVGLLALVDGASLQLLTGTPFGLACLTSAALLTVLGRWWMRWLIETVV